MSETHRSRPPPPKGEVSSEWLGRAVWLSERKKLADPDLLNTMAESSAQLVQLMGLTPEACEALRRSGELFPASRDLAERVRGLSPEAKEQARQGLSPEEQQQVFCGLSPEQQQVFLSLFPGAKWLFRRLPPAQQQDVLKEQQAREALAAWRVADVQAGLNVMAKLFLHGTVLAVGQPQPHAAHVWIPTSGLVYLEIDPNQPNVMRSKDGGVKYYSVRLIPLADREAASITALEAPNAASVDAAGYETPLIDGDFVELAEQSDTSASQRKAPTEPVQLQEADVDQIDTMLRVLWENRADKSLGLSRAEALAKWQAELAAVGLTSTAGQVRTRHGHEVNRYLRGVPGRRSRH
jgi:hypothetical protein